MNSTPTDLLRNTCAGITESRIFSIPLRVLAFRDEEADGEHLEMVFGAVEKDYCELKAIKPNRKYGTIPAFYKETKVC